MSSFSRRLRLATSALTLAAVGALSACGSPVVLSPAESSSSSPSSPSVAALDPKAETQKVLGTPAATPTAQAFRDSVAFQLTTATDTAFRPDVQANIGQGQYYYDSSGFIVFTLPFAAPNGDAALGEFPESDPEAGRPVGADLHGVFKAVAAAPSEAWQSVAKVEELKAGDLITLPENPNAEARDTNHFMMVLGPVEPAGDKKFNIRVADSATLPHKDDTRTGGANGLGSGVVTLTVNDGGAPTGYQWVAGEGEAKQGEVLLTRLS